LVVLVGSAGSRRILMDLSKLSKEERLVAEQAVLTLRALNEAAEAAPHGQGMACLEAVIHDKGLEHLRTLLAAAAGSRPEAQKRGSVSSPAAAEANRSSSG
jgi:hypothetical protein